MWFPHYQGNNSMHTGFPWYKQSFFNSFKPEYSVETYPMYPDDIFTEIQQGYDPLKVYIFYDASTSKSYLIQPINNKQVVISEIVRTKTKKGYQVYFDGILKPVEYQEFQIWTEYADLDAIKNWILERVDTPSETTNAHHAYRLVHNPKFKPLNWNYFPMSILTDFWLLHSAK